MDLTAIHPVNFYNNKVLQNCDIGNVDLYPMIEEINCIRSDVGGNIEDTLKDFIINNITNLTHTFIIKILEDNISKDEIAYLVDFYGDFNLRSYLNSAIAKPSLRKYSEDNICNIIYSSIIFSLNQFTQFYTIYKLVYDNEGVDLFKYLYTNTYGKYNPTEEELKSQNKYVFCVTTLNGLIEAEYKNIRDCCEKLKGAIYNIRILGGVNNV